MAYGILWVQQKLHKKSLPLLSAFHPIFKFSRKNHRWNMSPKKHVTENTSPKRSTDPDPTVTVTVWLRRQISMNSWNPELGGRAQMGQWDVMDFFHRKVLEICVFFFV